VSAPTEETVTIAEPRVHRGGSRGLLVLLGALSGLTPLSIDMYLPALPSLTRDLHTTSSATQLTLAALLVGLATGQLVAGPFSDRLGRRPPVLAGLAAFIVASIGCALAPNVTFLIGLRFLQGFAGAAAVVIARAVVRDLYEGIGAVKAFASLMLVTGTAPILAPILGAQVLRLTSWRGVFVVLAVAGALLLTAVWRALPETLEPDRRTDGGLVHTLRVFALLLRDPGFAIPTLAGGAGFAAMFAYIGGSPYVLQEGHGLSPQAYSAVFGVNAFVLIGLGQVSSRVVRRTGSRALLLTGAAISATGAVILLISTLADLRLVFVLLGLLLVAGAVGLASPNAMALALADHGDHAGAASALLGLTQFILGAVAAPLTGLGNASSGAPMAVTIAVASSVSLVAATACFVRARRPPVVGVS
jgi:DHA1 family bicyclomycin/chloramphenicol resistance-like MFS transporter